MIYLFLFSYLLYKKCKIRLVEPFTPDLMVLNKFSRVSKVVFPLFSLCICSSSSDEHQRRLAEVIKSIEETGTYEMTEKELIFASKTAWRNAPRCIGRIQWNNLQVLV